MKTSHWGAGALALALLWGVPALADGDDANGIILLHCDGVDGGTTFTEDADGSSGTWTANGNAHTGTEQSVFGGASYHGDGTGDYIETPDRAEWDFGTGAFTLELRVRFTGSLGDRGLIELGSVTGTGQRFMEKSADGGPQLGINGSYNVISATPTLDTWYAWAWVRESDGSTNKFYIDGTQTGASWANAANLTGATATGRVGANQAAESLNGWADEVRVSNNARYTANYTPQDHAFHAAGGGAAAVDNRFLGVNRLNRTNTRPGFSDSESVF